MSLQLRAHAGTLQTRFVLGPTEQMVRVCVCAGPTITLICDPLRTSAMFGNTMITSAVLPWSRSFGAIRADVCLCVLSRSRDCCPRELF